MATTIKETKEILFDKFGDLKEQHTCAICKKTKLNNINEMLKHLIDVHGLNELNTLNEYSQQYNLNVSWETEVKKEVGKIVKCNGEKTVRQRLLGIDTYIRKNLPEQHKNKVPLLDENYIFSTEEHKELISVLNNKNFSTVLVSGNKGMGKTEAVLNLAAFMNQPTIRFNMTGKTRPDHFLVEQTFDGKKLSWVDKSLVTCARNGYWWLCDEISASSPMVNFAMFMIMEKGVIHLNSGELLKCHPYFKMIFTDNRIGNPEFHKYQGTQEQNIAFLDRIKSVIRFNEYNESLLTSILYHKFPTVGAQYNLKTGKKDYIDRLIKLKLAIDVEYQKGALNDKMSLRAMENILDNYRTLGDMSTAFRLSYLNKTNQVTDLAFLVDLFNRFF